MRYLMEDREAFVISLEVLLTAFLVIIASYYTFFLVDLTTQRRYMSEILVNTCNEAARYGGNASKAYKLQVGDITIAQHAQEQMDLLCSKGYDTHISVSDYPNDNGEVEVWLNFKLKEGSLSLFETFGINKEQSMHFKIPSLVGKGKLIE